MMIQYYDTTAIRIAYTGNKNNSDMMYSNIIL